MMKEEKKSRYICTFIQDNNTKKIIIIITKMQYHDGSHTCRNVHMMIK